MNHGFGLNYQSPLSFFCFVLFKHFHLSVCEGWSGTRSHCWIFSWVSGRVLLPYYVIGKCSISCCTLCTLTSTIFLFVTELWSFGKNPWIGGFDWSLSRSSGVQEEPLWNSSKRSEVSGCQCVHPHLMFQDSLKCGGCVSGNKTHHLLIWKSVVRFPASPDCMLSVHGKMLNSKLLQMAPPSLCLS